MQVEVHLLLLRPARPFRRDVVGCALDAHDPLAVHRDAVPVLVLEDLTAEQVGPEAALAGDVGGIDDEYPTQDLYGLMVAYFAPARQPPVRVRQ
jgi:hypothetical protein